MKRLFITLVATAAMGVVVIPSYAGETHESHHAGTKVQKAYAAKGEVVSIDRAAGKIKLNHDAIPELGWSAMTMDFSIAQDALLEGVKVGEKVSFEIAKDQASGQFVIQKLQAIK